MDLEKLRHKSRITGESSRTSLRAHPTEQNTTFTFVHWAYRMTTIRTYGMKVLSSDISTWTKDTRKTLTQLREEAGVSVKHHCIELEFAKVLRGGDRSRIPIVYTWRALEHTVTSINWPGVFWATHHKTLRMKKIMDICTDTNITDYLPISG